MTSAKWAQKFYTRHYPDMGSTSDLLNQISHSARPIRSTTQIWVVTRHQYGVSALVSQKLIWRGNQTKTWPDITSYLAKWILNNYFLTLPEVGKLIILIMVIELSGEQFGLKSFDLSQVWFQAKIARHEVELTPYYSQFKIAEFNQYQQWLAVAPDKVARYPPYSLTYILKPC